MSVEKSAAQIGVALFDSRFRIAIYSARKSDRSPASDIDRLTCSLTRTNRNGGRGIIEFS